MSATADGRRFLLHDSGLDNEERFIMFGTNNNLDILREHRDWYADDTFKVAPRVFSQIYTIHAQVHAKVLPQVYVLMESRTEDAYRRMLTKLRSYNLNPLIVMADYEKAAQNAFQHIFPSAQLNRCFFDLAQSVYRKVQESGIQQQYADNADPGIEMKILPLLALLPPNDVIDAFENIPFSNAAELVISYFEDTYNGRKQ